MAGNCDSGYSCVYSSTTSWKSATQPLPKEVNPKAGIRADVRRAGQGPREARRDTEEHPVDFVREDAGDLTRQPGTADRRKMDEYFASIRDIELRIERASKLPPIKTPEGPRPNWYPGQVRGSSEANGRPDGIGVPGGCNAGDHVRDGERGQ
jgi:hypothetical protein